MPPPRPPAIPAIRAALIGLLATAPGWGAQADAGAGESAFTGRAFIGWSLAPRTAAAESEAGVETVFAGEVRRLNLRFGFERAFLAERLLPLFARPLDVPVLVSAAEFDGLEGLVPQPLSGASGAASPERASFALGSGVALARPVGEHEVGGRAGFAVFEIERMRSFERPGTVRIDGPLLRFAHALRFETDLVRGRIASEREESVVPGPELEVRVVRLPEADRPAAFAGAVGRFAVRTEVAPRDVDLGQSVELRVHVDALDPESSAALPRLAPTEGVPRLVADDGWRVQGTLDEIRAATRTFTWDLVATRAGVRPVPGAELAVFDPVDARYVLLASDRPDVRTVELGRAPSTPDQPKDGAGAATERGARTAAQRSDARGRRGPAALAMLVGLGLVLGAFAWTRRRRARARRGDAELRQRTAFDRDAATRAARALARALDEPDPNPANDPLRLEAATDALGAYLAARLGTTEAAVVGVPLAERLLAGGLESDLADELAELFDALVAARYGGATPAEPFERLRCLVGRLEPVQRGGRSAAGRAHGGAQP